MPYPSLYRAKAISATATKLTAYVPQVFGDVPIEITDFLGTPVQGMGWVFFQAGNPEFPVWTSGLGSSNGNGGGPPVGDHDEVWVGPTEPADPAIELWYDTDEPDSMAEIVWGVSVKDFGAKGNGLTDDSAAIQAAVNNVITDGGGAVFFPQGTYLMASAVTVYGAMTVTGTGYRSATLKHAPGASHPLLVSPDDGIQRYGLSIHDIGFDGNAQFVTGATNHGLIHLRGMNEVKIRDVYALRPRGHGIYIGQATAGIYNTVPVIEAAIMRGDQAYTNGSAISLDSGSSDAIVTNCDIGYFNVGAGVLMAGHNGASLINNNVWQCRYGYQGYQSSRTRFTACLADYSRRDGYVFQECNDLQITNCQARESSEETNNAYDGFRFETCARLTVMAGRAMGTHARYGLSVTSVTEGIVQFIGQGNVTGPYLATTSTVTVLGTTTPWTNIAPLNGWFVSGGDQPLQYRKIDDRVEIRGYIKHSNATSGALLMTLPLDHRPAYYTPIDVAYAPTAGYGLTSLSIHTNGQVIYNGSPGLISYLVIYDSISVLP